MRVFRRLLALTLLLAAFSPPGLAQGSMLNERLVQETAPSSAVYTTGADVTNFPGYREETYLQPQKSGDILYLDDTMIIAARTNYIRHGEREIGSPRRKEAVALIQMPLCWQSQEWVGRGQSIDLDTMHVTAILLKAPDFEISKDWLWSQFQPHLREHVTDKFCGGRTQRIFVDFFLYGLEHSQDGKVHSVDGVDYPDAETVLASLNKRMQELGPIQKVSATPTFLQADFYFWDKIEPEFGDQIATEQNVPATMPTLLRQTSKGLLVPAFGVQPSKGSYYEAFSPLWAGGAGFETARRLPDGDTIYDWPDAASYEDYLRGRQNVVAEEAAILQARKDAKISLSDVLLALARVQGAMRCLPDMVSDGTVATHAKEKWQAQNCSGGALVLP